MHTLFILLFIFLIIILLFCNPFKLKMIKPISLNNITNQKKVSNIVVIII